MLNPKEMEVAGAGCAPTRPQGYLEPALGHPVPDQMCNPSQSLVAGKPACRNELLKGDQAPLSNIKVILYHPTQYFVPNLARHTRYTHMSGIGDFQRTGSE
jgi:hypothetical protein